MCPSLPQVPVVEWLCRVGEAFAQPQAWVYLGTGLLGGYALGRFALAVVPPLALLYALAFLLGRADPGTLVLVVEGFFRSAWTLLMGAPMGLSLGVIVGFLSGISDR
ncbi:hypothetical protein [Thermus caldifontis]|uniref:hypothetical protein n=1 Tax=Thermus caldifontis TaxID=1930763 RepID=UPI000DF1D1D8|nr:hypothetical protein [Thermus caldifontis]